MENDVTQEEAGGGKRVMEEEWARVEGGRGGGCDVECERS